MSILLKNINGSELIAFEPEYYDIEMIISGISIFILFFGIVFGTLVIAAILRVGQKSVDTLFVLSLCSADLIFNLYIMTSLFIVMVNGGWSTGALGVFLGIYCPSDISISVNYLFQWL